MNDINYTITELAREFGLTTRAIRFYEDQGLLAPQRAGRNRVIDNAPPLAEGLPEAGQKQPHWTSLEFSDPN